MYTLYVRVVTQTHLSLSSFTQPCEERCSYLPPESRLARFAVIFLVISFRVPPRGVQRR